MVGLWIKLKGWGKGHIWPILRYYPSNQWRDWGKLQKHSSGSQFLGWNPQIWRNSNLLTMTFGMVTAIHTLRDSNMSCISPCHADQQQLVLLPAYSFWPQGFYHQAPLTQRMWWDGRQISELGGVQFGQVQEPHHCAVATCPQAVPLRVQNYPVSGAKSEMVRIVHLLQNVYLTARCKLKHQVKLASV